MLKYLWRLTKIAYQAEPKTFFVALIMMIVDAPASAMIVYSTAKIVQALGGASAAEVWTWIAIILASWFIKNTADVIYANRMDRLRMLLVFSIEKRYLEHASRLPYTILENPDYQAKANMLARKLSQVTVAYEAFTEMLASSMMILGTLTVILYIPWQVGVVMCLAMLLRALTAKKIAVLNWGIYNMETREGRRASYYRDVIENPTALLKAKGVGLQEKFIEHWERLVTFLHKKRLAERRVNSILTFLIFQIDNIGLGLGMVFIAPGILSGTSSVSSFVVFLTSYSRLLPNIREFTNNLRRYLVDAPIIALVFQALDIPTEQDKGKLIPKQSLTIKFDNVYFRYPGTDKDVLKGVSFEFQEGDHLALVGLNGAGKTTVLKLLMGVYEPTAGSITINGTPLNEIKPSALRRTLAIMSQEPPRYSDPISEQVYYGDYELRKDTERIEEAVEASGLSEIVDELPKGEDTMVGKFYSMPEDRAIELSGGQNQILDIARTLYRSARIYVFDEPTSAVDAEKEEAFFARLPQVLAGKAIIFVSHRFSTLRRAKRILVIEDGKLIEDGTHEQLIEKKGRYAELFALQAKNYQ